MEEVIVIPSTDEENNARTVLVTNISPQATNKTVSDFFAFCGTITSITMRTQTNSTEKVQEAIIVFSQEAATKTALLLTNALIIDRPINVVRFTGEDSLTEDERKAQSARVYGESEIENKPHQASAEERSQTSVVASLLAAGYQLAAGTLDTAKTYDERYAVTENIKGSVDTVVNAVITKTTEIDSQYKISETTSSWYKAASDKIGEVDRRYGVSDSASAVAASAEKVVVDLSNNPTVVATSQAIKSTSDAIANYADQVGKDVQKMIEENPTLKSTSDTIKETASSVQGVVEETGRLIRGDNNKEEEPYRGGDGEGSISTHVGESNSTASSSASAESATTTTSDSASTTTTATSSISAPEVNPSAGIGTDPPLEKRD